MGHLEKGSAERIGELADENALLRASLAEMRDRIDAMEQATEADTVTPLANRRRFMAELDRFVGHANRHGTAGALLAIELTNLRAINDLYGELAGDAALIHVARLLDAMIRTTDFAARIDGDDFGLILSHLDHNSAIETADRVARRIAAAPLDLGTTTVEIQAAIGIATILPGDKVSDVLERAHHNVRRARYGD